MGGQVMMALPSLSSLVPYMKSGRLRPLAVTSLQRSPLAPDVPTAAESGMPGFNLEVWWGLLTTAKSPPAAIKRFNDELNTVLASTEARDQLMREGSAPRPSTSEEFRTLLRDEVARWGKVIRDAKIPTD